MCQYDHIIAAFDSAFAPCSTYKHDTLVVLSFEIESVLSQKVLFKTTSKEIDRQVSMLCHVLDTVGFHHRAAWSGSISRE